MACTTNPKSTFRMIQAKQGIDPRTIVTRMKYSETVYPSAAGTVAPEQSLDGCAATYCVIHTSATSKSQVPAVAHCASNKEERSKQIRSSRKRGIVSQKISQSRVQKWKPSISPGNLDRKTQNTWNTKLLLRKETAQQTRNEMQGGNRCSTKKRGKTGAGGGIDLGPLLVQCRGGTTCTRGCARGGRSRRAV